MQFTLKQDIVTAHHGGLVCPNGSLMNRNDEICTVPATMHNCLSCVLHFLPGGNFWSPVVKCLPEKLSMKMAAFLIGRQNIPYISPSFQSPLSIANKLKEIEVLRQFPVRVIAPSPAIGSALVRNGVAKEKISFLTVFHCSYIGRLNPVWDTGRFGLSSSGASATSRGCMSCSVHLLV